MENHKIYRIVTRTITRMRDSANPYPGRIVEISDKRTSRLLVPSEVRRFGIPAACALEDARRNKKQQARIRRAAQYRCRQK